MCCSCSRSFHKFYWTGLQTGKGGAQWPNFTWVDQNQVIFRPNYQHWGYLLDKRTGSKQLEPNNLSKPEHCAGANTTLPWSQHGATAYGWADHNCNEQYISICEFAPPKVASSFTSSITHETYTFHQIPATFDDAQATCFAEGGRLASYSSIKEQYEVEQYYISKQMLIPTVHVSYWLGLSSNETSYPTFSWTDFTSGPTLDTYLHWGSTVPEYTPQPDNARGLEYCAVANYTQRFDLPPAWGWADTRCDDVLTFMCKKMDADAYVYVSPVSNATYILNTTAMPFAHAAQLCNDNGGFLVSYGSVEEQAEVEAYYSNMTYFIPVWHKAYYMGYRSTEAGGPFSWLDPQAQGGSYEHWGSAPSWTEDPKGACAMGDSSAITTDDAFGWSDGNCSMAMPFMCKIQRTLQT